MSQKSQVNGETKNRYCQWRLDIGNSAKKQKPADKVESLSRSQAGVMVMKIAPNARMLRVYAVRMGSRHS